MKQNDSGLEGRINVPEPEMKRTTFINAPHPDRYAMGKELRKKCPRSSHAEWKPRPDRPDPIELLLESEKERYQKLLPLRHGRMARSPFTFFRGAAFNMAADLGHTPVTGMIVQACGDAHLCNFGGFATPERNIIFSLNDLDETLPAPWEWDIKRLAASFVVACQHNMLKDKTARAAALEVVRSYREHMYVFSRMRTMDLWYFSMTPERLISDLKDPALKKRLMQRVTKEKSRSISEEIFPEIERGHSRKAIIKDKLPVIFHAEGMSAGEIAHIVRDAYNLYRESLMPAYRLLLDRYEIKDVAIKVVGVGSVGTACWVLLLMTADGELFFLQVKEARRSVLEPFAGESIYPNHGQRVINGYRLMQPYSDPFLGFTKGAQGRHYYFRQLRDIKISARVETFGKKEMLVFAGWCGQALALAHARSGDSAMMSGYMGTSDKFDQAIADFSFAYAIQNQKDYDALIKAIKIGRIETEFEE